MSTQKAKSLVCNECGLQLKTAQAATSHAVQTGHTDFAESSEAVRELLCTTCGKPCQTDVEADLHKRSTGHSTFTDKTDPSGAPLDLTIAPSNVTSSGKTVPGHVVKQIVEMGFSEARALHAMVAGCTAVESAIEWLSDHLDDASLDIPPEGVTIDDAPPKQPLTEAERRKKVEELQQRIAAQKAEKAEKDAADAREREKQRIANAKAAAEAREAHEERKRREAYDQMRREKEAERKARDKIRTELLADKLMKQGKDSETALREAKSEIERQHREAEEASRQLRDQSPALAAPVVSTTEWNLTVGGDTFTTKSAAPSDSAPAPVSNLMDLITAAGRLRTPPSDNLEGFLSISKAIPMDKRASVKQILGNIVVNPLDIRIRRMKLNNQAVAKALPTVECVQYLQACGFRVEGDELRLNTVVMRRLARAVSALERE